MPKFLCFLLIGFVGSALAEVDWADHLRDMDGMDVIFGGDSEEEERGIMTNSKGNDRCSYTDTGAIGCCARANIPLIGKHQLCINATANADEKVFTFGIECDGKMVCNKKFQLASTDRICDRLPGPAKIAKICLLADTKEFPDKSGFESCTKLEFFADTQKIGKFKFAGLQFKDGKLSLNDNCKDVSAKQGFVWKTHNPLKG